LEKGEISSTEPEEIVGLVYTPDGTYDAFPGIFTDQLPRRCFLDSSTVVLNTQWGSVDTVISVDTGTGNISRLASLSVILQDDDSKSYFDGSLDSGGGSSSSGDGTDSRTRRPSFLQKRVSSESYTGIECDWDDLRYASCTVHDVDIYNGGTIVFSASTPNKPARLGVYCVASKALWKAAESFASVTTKFQFNPAEGAKDVLSEAETVRRKMRDTHWKVIDLVAPSKSLSTFAAERRGEPTAPNAGFNNRFQAILIMPPVAAAGTVPLVVVPHGGPHSCMPTSFIAAYMVRRETNLSTSAHQSVSKAYP